MADISAFKNYKPGDPTCRLYIKNVAKHVEEKVNVFYTSVVLAQENVCYILILGARDSKTKDLVKSFPQSFDKNYLYMFCMEKARYKFLIVNYYYFLV